MDFGLYHRIFRKRSHQIKYYKHWEDYDNSDNNESIILLKMTHEKYGVFLNLNGNKGSKYILSILVYDHIINAFMDLF